MKIVNRCYERFSHFTQCVLQNCVHEDVTQDLAEKLYANRTKLRQMMKMIYLLNVLFEQTKEVLKWYNHHRPLEDVVVLILIPRNIYREVEKPIKLRVSVFFTMIIESKWRIRISITVGNYLSIKYINLVSTWHYKLR